MRYSIVCLNNIFEWKVQSFEKFRTNKYVDIKNKVVSRFILSFLLFTTFYINNTRTKEYHSSIFLAGIK